MRSPIDRMPERRIPSFWQALVFAALAAALLPGVAILGGPLVGGWSAVSLYLVALTCVHAVATAPSRRLAAAGLGANALAAVLLLALVGGGSAAKAMQLAVGCAVLVAFTRSLLYTRSRPLRTLVLEIALSGGGLLLARTLAGPSPLELAAALWAYLLVQSFHALAPGIERRAHPVGQGDPFERARERLHGLLEDA